MDDRDGAEVCGHQVSMVAGVQADGVIADAQELFCHERVEPFADRAEAVGS